MTQRTSMTRSLLTLLAAAACACSPKAGAPACATVDGTFELTVAGTGQSGDLGGACPDAGATQVIDVSLSNGQVSLNGETCSLCSTVGCEVDVVCGQSVTCPGSVTPVASPADGYVQALTFVVPTASAPTTGNATASLGANYCGYEGTAVRKGP